MARINVANFRSRVVDMFQKDQIVIDGLQYCNWDRELFEDLLSGGLTAIHATVSYWENTDETNKRLDYWDNLFYEFNDLILPVLTAEDIILAKTSNKTGIMLGFQNCSPIENDVFMVEHFFKRGVRFMQLTYNNQTVLGAGCFEDNDSGVSRFGQEVIVEMNRLGMVVDLSHAGEKTMIDAIKYSKKPVAISHANPKFFHNAKRNVSDSVLSALKDNEGLIGLSLYPFHLKDHSNCNIADFCDMIFKLKEQIGIDKIGIGSDLCSKWSKDVLVWMRNGKWTKNEDFGESKNNNPDWPILPSWFQKASDLHNIADKLLEKKMSSEDANKIMGENWFNFIKRIF